MDTTHAKHSTCFLKLAYMDVLLTLISPKVPRNGNQLPLLPTAHYITHHFIKITAILQKHHFNRQIKQRKAKRRAEGEGIEFYHVFFRGDNRYVVADESSQRFQVLDGIPVMIRVIQMVNHLEAL